MSHLNKQTIAAVKGYSAFV